MAKELKKYGRCSLTGINGNYVDSHIIPRALSKLDQQGMPMIQYGEGKRPKRRWTSWYDSELVTQEGENILKDLDTWAIKVLRELKLVWSGWGNLTNIDDIHNKIVGTPYGIRKVMIKNKERFRKFFLSILWRSACTSLPEFSEIQLPKEDLKKLGLYLCGKEKLDISFYPAMLTQLSTIGIPHNHTPIADTKRIESEDKTSFDIPIFRFYFDGLIVHFHRQASDNGYTAKVGNMIVGAKKELIVSTVEFEYSFQADNTAKLFYSYSNFITEKNNNA